jgi:MtN3 and saliva related transmembrane protein
VRRHLAPGDPAVIEAIGYAAAACTTFAFLPQVVHVWRTHSAHDISLFMYMVMVAGVALWIVYGLYIHSLPLVAANTVTLLLAGAVLAGKIRFRDRR